MNVQLAGIAAKSLENLPVEGIYALRPDDYYGLKPKVVVREGDLVKVGEPLFVNKQNPEMRVVSPVSGSVCAIVRGDRRKVLAVEVEADGKQAAVDYGVHRPQDMNEAEVKAFLMETGMLALLKKRPYDVTAEPDDVPKAVFVTAFSRMPLAADTTYVLKGREQFFLKGIEALSRVAKVYLGICPEQVGESFTKTEFAEVTVFDGPNPSGNVGVQINHLSPVNKGEVVWTASAETVALIGHVFATGHVSLKRIVALAGSCVNNPCYYSTPVGVSLSRLTAGRLNEEKHVRLINGNPLVGQATTKEDYLGTHVTEVTAIPEGDDKDEILGWMMPRWNDFSVSRSYFSWLQGKRKLYDLDARVKGGERHIIMSGEYDRVFPMDIMAGYLVKAILTGDIDRMEQLGIYEVSPEDFAVAEFVDSSKLELQRIVREGLDMLRKEMA